MRPTCWPLRLCAAELAHIRADSPRRTASLYLRWALRASGGPSERLDPKNRHSAYVDWDLQAQQVAHRVNPPHLGAQPWIQRLRSTQSSSPSSFQHVICGRPQKEDTGSAIVPPLWRNRCACMTNSRPIDVSNCSPHRCLPNPGVADRRSYQLGVLRPAASPFGGDGVHQGRLPA